MYTLYYSPGACSMAVHILLEELGASYEAVKVDLRAGEGQKPEFLKLNPRGQVPVLVEDGAPLKEGAAIIIHLLEQHNSPLLPKDGPERAAALEWICWCNATLHPAYGRAMWLKRNVADEKILEDLLGKAYDHVAKLWQEAEQRLAGNAWLAGGSMTAADIMLAVFANWQGFLSRPVAFGDNVNRVIRAVSSRPSSRKVFADEGVEYRAAA